MKVVDKNEPLSDTGEKGETVVAESRKTLYARELRVVGQALESQQVYSLDLELQGELYIVRGRITASSYAESSFSAFIQDFVFGVGSILTGSPRRSMYEVGLSYNAQDIEALDSKGRSQRRDAHQNPDPYSLAQKLRGVGSFLDHRPATILAGVSVEDRWVTVRYLTAEGRIEEAKEDVSYFYNYWVEMYLRRAQRSSKSLSDDPTLQVTWERSRKHEIPSSR